MDLILFPLLMLVIPFFIFNRESIAKKLKVSWKSNGNNVDIYHNLMRSRGLSLQISERINEEDKVNRHTSVTVHPGEAY